LLSVAVQAKLPLSQIDTRKNFVITFNCRTCGRTLNAKDKYAGRIVQCGASGLRQIVPEDLEAQPSDPKVSSHDDDSAKAIPYAEPVASYQAPNVVIQMPRDNPPPSPRQSKGYECPYCHTDEYPIVKKQISTAGWVLFVVLLIACFPLCIIGLFITDTYRICGACGIRLG
jgi:hypothetical protein